MTAGVRPIPSVSVVVATYNRAASVERLLRELATQTLAASRFEVIVVDDGSERPVESVLASIAVPFELTVVTQANGGPSAARHAGVLRARAELIVMLDDDMVIPPDFLSQHLAAHPPGSRLVVLGRLRAPKGRRLPLFERLHLALLDRRADAVRAGRAAPAGGDLYTGNVSLNRSDYLSVGGFDLTLRLSEDAELGVRLENAGVGFAMSEEAVAQHASDHSSLAAWMRRSIAYGAADASIARKHRMLRSTAPWRYLVLVNVVSRPFLLGSALAPSVFKPIAWLGMGVAMALGAVRLERAALAGATLVYGILYFQGIRAEAGSRGQALRDLAQYLNRCEGPELGLFARVGKLAADVYEDHEAIVRADLKYSTAPRRAHLLVDFVQRIGFQMMVAYRAMRFFRDTRLGLIAKLTSRAIRHLYGADIHWDAELSPGVMIVHGTGLVVGHAARVRPGCILFQHVTLGESIGAESRQIGAPVLEEDVHVGPGATLLGPITVGAGSKITALTLLMTSVPARSLVEAATPTIRSRATPRRNSAESAVMQLPPSRPARPAELSRRQDDGEDSIES